MKKLLLYTLLAASSATPLALYAAHEHELPEIEECDIENEASRNATDLFLPLPVDLREKVLAYATEDYFSSPEELSASHLRTAQNGFSNPNLNSMISSALVAREAAESLVRDSWNDLNLPPMAQYGDPLLVQVACDLKGALQRRGVNQYEIIALELGILDAFPNSTLAEQDRRTYIREGSKNLGTWQTWREQKSLEKYSSALANRRADIEFLISSVIQNKQKYSLAFRTKLAQNLEVHPLLSCAAESTKKLVAVTCEALQEEIAQIEQEFNEEFVVID